MTKISSLTALTGAGVDTAADLLAIVDMSLAGAARNKKITIDEFALALQTFIDARVAAGATGLLDFKGSTDCSANPNYPAASKGDFYVVSVAGKIGGASGVSVEVGDAYFAEADNAGGTQASVGTDWSIVQGNTTGAGAGIDVEDEGTPEASGATTLNFTGSGVTAADVGGGVVDITIPGATSGIDVEDEGVTEATGALVLNFTGSGVTATDAGGGTVDIDVPGSSGAAFAAAGTGQTVTGVYDFSVDGAKANVDFIGLGSYNELLVTGRGLTCGTTGVRQVQVSVDNGSTWFTSSGDYKIVDSAGAEANGTGFNHSTNSTAARTIALHIRNLKGTEKQGYIHNTTGLTTLFVASASDINAIRVSNSGGGNFTAGTIRVLAR